MSEEEMYKFYEKVRKSGVTNMFDIRVVSELSGLNEKQVIFVMRNYSKLKNKYEKMENK